MSNELQTIDLAALAQVSGGANSTTSSSTGATNDQILTALNGILDSIKNLGQPSNQGLNQQEMLMLMLVMSQRNQAQVAYAPSPWSQEPIIRYY